MANNLVLESRNGNLNTTLPRRMSGCLIAILFVVLQCGSSALYAADFKNIQIKGPRGSTEQFSGVTYGPIDSDDTLWRIADRYRQGKKYSIYQVMVAIQELNPDAFNSDNLNSMKNGVTLQLPSDRFIERIDIGEAKNKSEDDDSTWKVVKQSQPASRNIKPPEKLASQNDLTQTKADIENKLNEIDAEQQRQFEVIRQQFAESIESVQSLLDENRKIYERLDVVNEDIDELRNRIGDEGEVQQQMDQILAMQSELLANSRKAQEESSNFDVMEMLTSPAVLIGGTVLVSLSFLVGLAMWLLRRTRKEEPEVQEMDIPEESHSAMEEMDNLSDALSDELSGDKTGDDASDDLFGDDDLLDDVLAEELDDSLDEVLENELGSFDDLDDDILVSNDTGTEDEFEQAFGDDAAEDDLASTEFDVFGGDDDGIEITDSEDTLEDDIAGDSDDLAGDIDDIDAAGDTEDEATDNFDDFDIPSGIEENQPDEPESKPGVYDPEGDLNLTSGDVLSDEDMEKVGDKIGEATRELNDITKELMKDLKQAPDKDPGDPDIAIEQPEAEEEEDDFEEFSGELTADFLSDVLSDEEPSADQEPSAGEEPSADEEPSAEQEPSANEELSAEPQSEADDSPQEDLADELLAEFGIDAEAEPETPQNEQEDLADELLAEFGIDTNETTDSDADETDKEEEAPSPQEDLADEILSEFGIDADEEVAPEPSQQDDMADELLAEFGIDPDEVTEQPDADFEEDAGEQDAPSNTDDSEAELEAIPDNQTVDNNLADDLLAEFGIDSDDLAAGAEAQISEEADSEEADSEEADSEAAAPDEAGSDTANSDVGSNDTENDSSSLEQELLAEMGMADDDDISVDAQSNDIDSEPDTPEPEEETEEPLREYAIDKMSEDDYQTLLSELDFDTPPTPPQDHGEPQEQPDTASGGDELDDIDALLAQHSPDAGADAQEDTAKKDEEPDDIEMLLAQHSPESASSETGAEQPDTSAANSSANIEQESFLEIEEDFEVDIDGALNDTTGNETEVAPEAESAAPESESSENKSDEASSAFDPSSAFEMEGDDDSSLIDEIDLDDTSPEEETSSTSLSELSNELEPESAEIDFDLEFDEEEELGNVNTDIDLTEPAGASEEEFKLDLERDDVDFELDMEDETADIPELTFENEVDIPTAEPELEIELEATESEEANPASDNDSLESAADELAFELDDDANDSLAELIEDSVNPAPSAFDNKVDENAPNQSGDDYSPEIPDELDAAVDDLMGETPDQPDNGSDNTEDGPELELDDSLEEAEPELSFEEPLAGEEPSAEQEPSADQELSAEQAPSADALPSDTFDSNLDEIAQLVTDDDVSIPMTEPDTLSEMLSDDESDANDTDAAEPLAQSPADEEPVDANNEPFIDELEAAADALMAEDDELDGAPVLQSEDTFSIVDSDEAQLTELEEALSDSPETDGADIASVAEQDIPSLQEQLQETSLEVASVEEASPLPASPEPELSDEDDDYIDDAELDAALREFEEADLNSTLPDEVSADKELAEPISEVPDATEPETMDAEPVVESSLLDSELEDVPGLGDWLGETNTMSQSDVTLSQNDESEPVEEWLGSEEANEQDDDLPPLDDLEFSLGDDINDEGADPELDAMLNSVEDELAETTQPDDKFTSADLEGMEFTGDAVAPEGELDEPESLANISFDALLNSIEEPEDIEPQNIVSPEEATLDNPDLDLGALLDEDITPSDATATDVPEEGQEQSRENFTDVEDLLAESVEAETQSDQEQDLNLDALLSEYSGIEDDADTLDVDLDSGNSAKLDLARAYIEINDTEAARELLNELKSEGSPEELAEVDELLKKLN